SASLECVRRITEGTEYMSKLVSKVLATGAAVSILTLPGASPPVAGPDLGAGQSSATTAPPSDTADDAAASAGTDDASASTGTDDAAADDTAAQAAEAGTQVQLLNITDFHGRIS